MHTKSWFYKNREREVINIDINKIYNDDCMSLLPQLSNNSINLTLTDIPYNAVNRDSNGLRSLDKKDADVMTFNLEEFLNEVFRVTQSTIIIFCGKEQLSPIYEYFAEKQNKKLGTVRQLIWEKTNPSPMNGEYIYLSGIENAVWFKKKGGTFTARCKNTVFRHPAGRSKFHPTEKNAALLSELISDNSFTGDIVLDPCCGSGSHCLSAYKLNRNYIGIELNKEYFDIATSRLSDVKAG